MAQIVRANEVTKNDHIGFIKTTELTINDVTFTAGKPGTIFLDVTNSGTGNVTFKAGVNDNSVDITDFTILSDITSNFYTLQCSSWEQTCNKLVLN
jgi:hypothetical protein